jgi:RNA polymerase sigma factor (sigma-70 family)
MRPRISTRLLATQSDRRLLELARTGNERAFEALVQRYRRPLLRYCGRLGLADGRAEDALQHALLEAWLALERGAEVRELRPWLYRIVHNTAVNQIRSSRDDLGLLGRPGLARSSTAAVSELDRRIAVRDALADVAALPQMQRDAMLLSAVAGRSHEEVATALGIPQGAVRGLLYRARVTLRAAAAALSPQPLINWACSSAGSSGPTGERILELSGPAGTAGMTGVVLKSAAMAATAAVLVSGPAVPLHGHGAPRPKSAATAARVSRALAATSQASSRSVATGAASSGATLSASTGSVGGLARSGARDQALTGDRLTSSSQDEHSPAFRLGRAPTGERSSNDGGNRSGAGDRHSSDHRGSREVPDASLSITRSGRSRDGASAAASDRASPDPSAADGSGGGESGSGSSGLTGGGATD